MNSQEIEHHCSIIINDKFSQFIRLPFLQELGIRHVTPISLSHCCSNSQLVKGMLCPGASLMQSREFKMVCHLLTRIYLFRKNVFDISVD